MSTKMEDDFPKVMKIDPNMEELKNIDENDRSLCAAFIAATLLRLDKRIPVISVTEDEKTWIIKLSFNISFSLDYIRTNQIANTDPFRLFNIISDYKKPNEITLCILKSPYYLEVSTNIIQITPFKSVEKSDNKKRKFED